MYQYVPVNGQIMSPLLMLFSNLGLDPRGAFSGVALSNAMPQFWVLRKSKEQWLDKMVVGLPTL